MAVKDVEDSRFKIDLENKTWSYRNWKDVPIGEARSLYDSFSGICKEGIIGVYVKNSINDLNKLVHDSNEFLKSNNQYFSDD